MNGKRKNGLKVRALNALVHEGIKIEELPYKTTRARLLRLPNFGKQSLGWLDGELERQGLPPICKTEEDLKQRLEGINNARRHQGLPQFFVQAVRMALKVYPPEKGETMEQWMKRVEAISGA